MTRRRRLAPILLAVAAGCAANGSKPPTSTTEPALTVTSTAFGPDGAVPVGSTCDGAGTSPALSWSPPPAGTAEVAVTVTDPDAPGGTFIHWVLLGIPPGVHALAAGGPAPEGSRTARATSGQVGYVPPCPPRGALHHYQFSVYALPRAEALPGGVAGSTALSLIRASATASGTLTGTYARQSPG
jgi:Raf kinase inhibitor-like YbhB/YbcL family protein